MYTSFLFVAACSYNPLEMGNSCSDFCLAGMFCFPVG